MWSVSYVTCIDLIEQISLGRLSAFLFLDNQTLKLGFIIILPTDRSEIVLPTARTTKNSVVFALSALKLIVD